MFRSSENNVLRAGFSTVSRYNREQYSATAVAGAYINHSLIELFTFINTIFESRKEGITLYFILIRIDRFKSKMSYISMIYLISVIRINYIITTIVSLSYHDNNFTK